MLSIGESKFLLSCTLCGTIIAWKNICKEAAVGEPIA